MVIYTILISIMLSWQSVAYPNCHNSLNSPAEFTKNNYETFQVLETLEGQHGGKLFKVKRKGGWFDFKKELDTKTGDLVADLRFFPPPFD